MRRVSSCSISRLGLHRHPGNLDGHGVEPHEHDVPRAHEGQLLVGLVSEAGRDERVGARGQIHELEVPIGIGDLRNPELSDLNHSAFDRALGGEVSDLASEREQLSGLCRFLREEWADEDQRRDRGREGRPRTEPIRDRREGQGGGSGLSAVFGARSSGPCVPPTHHIANLPSV